MVTFLHAADIHLDSPLRKLEHYEGAPVEALRGATRRAFENLVELAISTRTDFVLIAGDLYDGDWKDYNTGLYFVSQMSKLREAGIPVYITAGNHDAASKMTKTLQLPKNVRMFPTDSPETVYLDDLGIAIHAQGFPKRIVKKNLSAAYPTAVPGYFNIGMLHTCATGREGHDNYAPCTVGGLQSKGYDYWALGHVHQRETLCENPLIVFPGNIQGRHIREAGVKGCMMVSINGNEQAEARFQPLDVIRWMHCEIDASDARDGDDVLRKVHKRLEEDTEKNDDMPLAVRVEITGASHAHAELSSDAECWTNEIRSIAIDAGGSEIWIEKTKFRTRFPAQNDPGDVTSGPIGEIFSFLDDAQSNPEKLEIINEALDNLRKKLRREMPRDVSNSVFPDNPKWLTDRLDEAKTMLIRRLTQNGEAL